MHVKFNRIVTQSLISFLIFSTILNLIPPVAAFGAGAKAGWQAEWEKTLQAAAKEGKVVIYTGGRGTYNWEKIFGEEGARWFHTGGIFCALLVGIGKRDLFDAHTTRHVECRCRAHHSCTDYEEFHRYL